MKGWHVGSLLLMLLAGCEQKLGEGFAERTALTEGPVAGVAASRQPPPPAPQPPERFRHAAGSTLAYEHTVSVELAAALIAERIRQLQTACASRKESECTLLDVSLESERSVPSGNVRMRLAPVAVDALVAVAAQGGKIISRKTHAEDLAEPVADTERELALLSSHRDRLEGFLRGGGLKVEQLIAVSRELSSVLTQIDELNTRRANLRRRIDTELLTIELAPPFEAYGAQQTPVHDALKSFGTDFLRAIAQVITFVAFLVPWLIIIVPGLFLLRLLWRTISRWLTRREVTR